MGKPEAELYPLGASAKGTHYLLICFYFVQRVFQHFSIMQHGDKLFMVWLCVEELQKFSIYSLLMIAWYFVEHHWKNVMSYNAYSLYMRLLPASNSIKPRLPSFLVRILHVQYRKKLKLDSEHKSSASMKNTLAFLH